MTGYSCIDYCNYPSLCFSYVSTLQPKIVAKTFVYKRDCSDILLNCSNFAHPVILRHEESHPDETDTSFLSTTEVLKDLAQSPTNINFLAAIAFQIPFKKKNPLINQEVFENMLMICMPRSVETKTEMLIFC